MMAHDELKEMLPSHALSALDAPDERLLKEHLAGCQSCRGELDDWRSTAAVLAFATNILEPSPALRERILRRIREEKQTPPGESGATGVKPGAVGPAKVIPFTRRTHFWSSVGTLAAIAAGLAMVALIISLLVLWRENRASRDQLARLSLQIRATQQQLEHERETVALLTTPGARLTELAGTNVAPGAHAMLAYDKNGRAILFARGLPAAPPGKAYQLWFIVGNQKLPGKVFNTDDAGEGDLKDQIPAAALGATVFAVTLEAASGATSPTGAIFLLSSS